ncbi:hypothetical protein D3C71_328830 [compost metagenome]
MLAINFQAVADAPLTRVPLAQLLAMLAAANSPVLVVSKQSKGSTQSTTAYVPSAHALYRATHDCGARVVLKSLCRQNRNVRLLAHDERVAVESADMPALAANL